MKNTIYTILLFLCPLLAYSQLPFSESALQSQQQLHSYSLSGRSGVSRYSSAVSSYAVPPVVSVGGSGSYCISAGTASVEGQMSDISSCVSEPFSAYQVPMLRRVDSDDDDDWGYGGGSGVNPGDPAQNQFNPIEGDELLLLYAVLLAMAICLLRYIQRRKAQNGCCFDCE